MNSFLSEYVDTSIHEYAATTYASSKRPFIGLRPYAFADHDFFFGRDEQIAVLQAALLQDRLLSVVGSSGSGKSSLIRAGLLPRLAGKAGGEWNWVEMRPGDGPIRRLAEALARPGLAQGVDREDPLTQARAERIDLILRDSSFGISDALKHSPAANGRPLLILVDQFEEIFRFSDMRTQLNSTYTRAQEQRDEATLFVQLLLAARDDPDFHGQIILTMRSDFIGDCARFNQLAEAVTATQYLVPCLTRDQRALAIRGPIERANAEVDPALVQRVLNDTNEDPDQLPVMQHALMRCWQHANARRTAGRLTLTEADYLAIGGTERALSLHATEISAELATRSFSGLSAIGVDSELAVKRIYQCLTDTDSRGRATRRPQTLCNIVDVITPDECSADKRVGVTDDVKRLLKRFSDADCSFLRTPEDSTLTKESVIDIGHEALIRRWDKLGAQNGTNWVREEQRDADRLSDLARIAHYQGLIPIATLPAFELWWQKRRPTVAWASRYSPDGAERLQVARQVLARSQDEVQRRRRATLLKRTAITSTAFVVLLAALGIVAWNGWKAERRADEAVQEKQRYLSILGRYQLDLGRTSSALFTSLYGLESAKLENAHHHRTIGAWIRRVLNEPSAEPASELQALAYKALENLDETRVLNLKTSAHAVAYDGPQGLLVAVPGLLLAWNPDTNTLAKVAAFGTDGKSTGETPVDLAVSPDNTRALVGMFSQNLYLVDIAGRKAMRLADTPSGNNGVFSPDGEHLVTWGWSGAPARMWRRAGSSFTEVPQYFSDLAADVRTAAYTRDATRIALGSLKGVVYVLDVKSVGHPGDLRQSLQPDGKVDGLISSIAFHPRDSDLLLVIKAQHPYLCRLTTGACAQAHEGSAIRGSFSPDGQYAAVVTNDGTLYVYRMLHGRDVLDRPEHTFKFGRSGRSMAWNPASPQELAVAALASDERQLPPDANTKGSVWVWNVTSALSRNIKESAPLTATAMTHPIHLSHPAVEIFRDPRGGAVRVAARRSGISSGDLVLDGRTSEPLAAGLSPTAEWLAWSLPDGGILLFHLTKSLAPMALLGESTKWERLQFAANNVLVAQDHSGTRHVWREFDGSDNLASFARDSLPLQSHIDDLSSIPENPTKLEPPTRLLPSDAECRNLLGKWITPAHDADEGRAPAALKPPRRDGAICG